jgi:hypothetical protein
MNPNQDKHGGTMQTATITGADGAPLTVTIDPNRRPAGLDLVLIDYPTGPQLVQLASGTRGEPLAPVDLETGWFAGDHIRGVVVAVES